MSRALYALTLHRPWPALIVAKLKPIENRDWAPPPTQLKPGEWFAIHAGKAWDASCRDFAIANKVPPAFFDDPRNLVDSAIVGVARFDGTVTESNDPWFFGGVGWLIGDAVAIEPVPCRGFQKLWKVPDAIADEVRARFRVARPREGATT